jgi:hypothetical protein
MSLIWLCGGFVCYQTALLVTALCLKHRYRNTIIFFRNGDDIMSYYSERENKRIQEFDRQQTKRRFEKQYKEKIENGLTREQFQREYSALESDLVLYDNLKAEVELQAKHDEAFLQGFNSVK